MLLSKFTTEEFQNLMKALSLYVCGEVAYKYSLCFVIVSLALFCFLSVFLFFFVSFCFVDFLFCLSENLDNILMID